MQSGCEWIIDSILWACVGIVATHVKTCSRWAGIPDLTELPMESTARSPSISLFLSLSLSIHLGVSLWACRCCGSAPLVRKQDARSTCMNMKMNMSSCVCVLSCVHVFCHVIVLTLSKVHVHLLWISQKIFLYNSRADAISQHAIATSFFESAATDKLLKLGLK